MGLRMRMLEGLATVDGADAQRPSLNVNRISSASAPSDKSSGYEIPSYYLRDSSRQSAVLQEETDAAEWRSSRGIPSYYFKEHDAEGRSIGEGRRRSNSGVTEPILWTSRPGMVLPRCRLGHSMNKDDADEVPCSEAMVSRSLTGSTAVGDEGRRRSDLSTTDAADTKAGAAHASRDGGDGWEAVYCSGWKGLKD